MSDFELHYWYGWLEGYIQACEVIGEVDRKNGGILTDKDSEGEKQ